MRAVDHHASLALPSERRFGCSMPVVAQKRPATGSCTAILALVLHTRIKTFIQGDLHFVHGWASFCRVFVLFPLAIRFRRYTRRNQFVVVPQLASFSGTLEKGCTF